MFGRRSLWLIVALGAVTIVTASVISSKEKPKTPAESTDDEEGSCCGAGGGGIIRPAIETIGRPEAPVKVIGFVEDKKDYDAMIAMLRELVSDHADAVQVTLHAWTTQKAKDEMARLGHEGPGFFVDARNEFTLRSAGGGERKVVFEGTPDKDYKASDLKAAVEQAMAGGAAPASDPGKVN